MAHDLEEAHHGELADVSHEVRPLGVHVIAAQAHHGEAGLERAQVPQKLAAVQVARRLTTGEEQASVLAQ